MCDKQDNLKVLWQLATYLEMELRSMLPNALTDSDQVVAVLEARAATNHRKLTYRHLDAARALMQTETLKEAAGQLGISLYTMRNHVRAIIQRTGLPLGGAAELRGWCLGVKDLQSSREIWYQGTK